LRSSLMRCPTVTKAPPHPSYLICILYIFLQFTQLILHNMRMKHIMSKTHMGVMRMFTTPLRKARLNAKMPFRRLLHPLSATQVILAEWSEVSSVHLRKLRRS
jgi:hypothetical protein